MRKKNTLFSIICMLLISPFIVFADTTCASLYGSGDHLVKVATGSLGRLGLLKSLGDGFDSKYDARICFVYAGSGKALELLKSKEVDVILVHSENEEIKAIQEGWADKRTLVCSNEYYIVGPVDDPAGIKKSKKAITAYKMIATQKARFLSRGDNSGTHIKELEIWNKADLAPRGKWYIVTNNNMTETLKAANELGGYFMPESTTWITGKNNYPSLKLLFKGDRVLLNIYHILLRKYGKDDYNKYAEDFLLFVKSEKGQTIIKNFGKDKYGQALFNDANTTRRLVE